jgi:hypothetical protein
LMPAPRRPPFLFASFGNTSVLTMLTIRRSNIWKCWKGPWCGR